MNESCKDQRIVSIFEKKFSLFHEYHTLTKKMKEAFASGQEKRAFDLLLERRSCMNRIEKADLTLKKWARKNNFQLSKAPAAVRGFLDDCLCRLREMMKSIDLMDRDMLEFARVEAGTLRAEILHRKRAKTAASGYRTTSVNSPRFLDTKR